MNDDDFEKQRAEWETFARAQGARGICPHSGLTFPACKASICDCFDYPSGTDTTGQVA